jgi:transcriptional regulator of acetoin/glycerol metabolism
MTSRKVGSALRDARNILTERREVPEGLIDEVVARSWRRSIESGLAPTSRRDEAPHFSAAELTRITERQHELISNARPVMEYLSDQTRNTGSIVILADDRGVLLHVVGDVDFMNRAERVALVPGASWNERYRGTNAIGLALAENIPIEVRGGEHYLARNGFLTCAAAPIFSPQGRAIGILDISGDQRNRRPYALDLVRTAAQMIENRLFNAHHGEGIRLHFHSLAEGIGTAAEGVAALSDDGWIVAANQSGLVLLGITAADLGVTPIARVLGLRVKDLTEWFCRKPGEPMLTERTNGNRLFIRIKLNRHTRGTDLVMTDTPKDSLAALNTGDARIHAAIEKVRKVMGKPIPLLLVGESGVGKELFARAIHDSGPRSGKPFIAVNCAALPETLIESELFGYTTGAFTGARRGGAPGYIREANGGTLFLDEIGDIPVGVQGRLLRVLQERQVAPLGGGKPIAVDFLLICATNRRLKTEMESGNFRADLYYRINGLTLELPPLRERSDLRTLIANLLEDVAPERGITLDNELMAAFADYPWPGNLRQLANALRTACALLDGDKAHIDWHHISDDLLKELNSKTFRPRSIELSATENLRAMSDAMIDQIVNSSGGNMSEAARRLGISRNTLYRRIKKENSQGMRSFKVKS